MTRTTSYEICPKYCFECVSYWRIFFCREQCDEIKNLFVNKMSLLISNNGSDYLCLGHLHNEQIVAISKKCHSFYFQSFIQDAFHSNN